MKLNVQFQKISIPTPSKVNGNSKGEGGRKSTVNFVKVILNWNYGYMGVDNLFSGTAQYDHNHEKFLP